MSSLLGLPERRQSIGPELIRFFEQEAGKDWANLLDRFLGVFAGTTFQIPGPEFLASLRTDKTIIRSLKLDQSIGNQIKLIEKHGVTFSHMQRIWQAVVGKMLCPPQVGRADGVIEAAQIIRRHPRIENDITMMFNLSAKERVRTIAIVLDMRRRRSYDAIPKEQTMAKKQTPRKSEQSPTTQPKPGEVIYVPRRVTQPQKRFIAMLRNHGSSASPSEMKEMIGTISPTKTIAALVQHGLVKQSKSGRVSLTTKGKSAA